ncbi:hypothetical protein ACIPL1_09655 [Pseudomonas sp. NPDC090202]|uniref:hypothetical protein n=1 Tax=Pseudomonas sp. NPDC090202 TaxID=3364476 RepID=UPI00381B6C63
MNIKDLPKNPKGGRALNPLVFTGFDDSPNNPRPGLGYKQLFDTTVPVGLIAALPATVREGDLVVFYWDDIERQKYEVDQGSVDRRWLSFSVSPAVIKDPSGRAYYTVADPFSGDIETSDVRTVTVNRLPPGGLDPDISTPINEKLAPATIIPPVINAADTNVTVTVPEWENMELGDELTVLWDGIRVDQPKLDIIGGPQIVPIPREVLEQAGSNERLPVTYEIRDIVDNYSLVSLSAFAAVDIGSRLVAPRVREADPVTLILDLQALGSGDANVDVAPYGDVQVGDELILKWTGRTGAADIPLPDQTQVVSDADRDPVVTFRIPNAHLQLIVGGAASASYVRRRGSTDLPSKRTSITLTGMPLELAAPGVEEANGRVIDLGQITTPDVHVVIAAYPGKKAGDRINLIWSGEPASGPPSHYTASHIVTAGEEAREHVFAVDTLLLEPLIDGALALQYQVVYVDSARPADSKTINYAVIGAFTKIEDFTGMASQIIQANQSIDTGKITIHFVSGAGNAGFPENDSLPSDPGPLALPVLHVCFQNPVLNPGTQTLEIDLQDGYVSVQCHVHGSNGKTEIAWLDSSQTVIDGFVIPDQTHYPFVCNSTRARPIHRLRIIGDKDWTRWDNFVMTP